MPEHRVNQLVRNYFAAITQIRRATNAIREPEMLYSRMCTFLEQAMRQAEDLGFLPTDIQDIGYVLAALGDEVALSAGTQLRDYWLPRLLQLKYFNENTAGEGVFQRVDMLLSDRNRAEVLRVYYLALCFGYQGKYRIRGGAAQLESIIDRVRTALSHAGQIVEVELSPHGDRPAKERGGPGKRFPFVLVSAAILLVAIGVYFGLRVNVGNQAERLTESFEEVGSE